MFLDVHDRCIKSTDMAGAVRIEIGLPYVPGALEVLPDGQLLVGDAWRRVLYRLVNERHEQIADLSRVAQSCLSDAIVASQGRIYLGDVGFDFLDPFVDPVPKGMIILINDRGNTSLVADDLYFPNGMVITPDERTLIVAERLGHRLTAFDIAGDGSLSNRRLWAQLPDDISPNGICLDCEGAIWASTASPCALRVLEGGRIDDRIDVERSVYAVALGGPEGKHLFLCTSASSDPIITRRMPSASIALATVEVSGNPVQATESLPSTQ